MKTINVGIRFQPLGAEQPNVEDGTFKKHWVLVFTPPSQEFTFTFEAVPGRDDAIHMPIRFIKGHYDSYTLGAFSGEWEDLIKILEAHPQRGTTYSACFNNCQHFVAIFLIFLMAYAKDTSGKGWSINNSSRCDSILSVLNVEQPSERKIWNDSNIGLATLKFLPVPAAGAAALGAAAAAEATVATTVSAGGIAGWFGVTTTVLAPAAYAGIASVCAPLALASGGVAGAAYLLSRSEWKAKTIFDNPVVNGFPSKWFSSMKDQERSYPDPTQIKARYIASYSLSATASTVLVGSGAASIIPMAVSSLNANALYALATMVILAS